MKRISIFVRCRALLPILFLPLALGVSTISALEGAEVSVRTVGVLSFRSRAETRAKWHPLAVHLTRTIPGLHFRIQPLFYTEFESAIEGGSLDYILTNPAHSIAISQRHALSGAIGTLVEKSGDRPRFRFGGVIFTRNEPGTPRSLADLVGRTIGAVARDSLGGYQAQAFEMKGEGIDIEEDVAFVWTGMPHANVLDAVLEGEVDAGFVRTGVIEAAIGCGRIRPDELVILHEEMEADFDQRVSTTLYPEWPFLAMNHIDPRQAQRVAASLFLMEDAPRITEAIGIHGFTIPSNYIPVELLMTELGIPPFDHKEPITLAGIWKAFSVEILLSSGFLLTLLSYALHKTRTGRLLAEKNRELSRMSERLRTINRELEAIAITDPLTGLHNRRHFELFLEEKRHHAQRYGKKLAVCVLDVDDFKGYNDAYGHHVGDEVLVRVAHVLKCEVRRSLDMVARYAGDEFVMVLYDIHSEGLEGVARNLVRAVEALRVPVAGDGHFLGVSISMGIAMTDSETIHSKEAWFQTADRALYEVKRTGKNGYCILPVRE